MTDWKPVTELGIDPALRLGPPVTGPCLPE